MVNRDFDAAEYFYVDFHNGRNDSIVNLHIVPRVVFDPLLDPNSLKTQSEDHHVKFTEDASLTSLYTVQDKGKTP